MSSHLRQPSISSNRAPLLESPHEELYDSIPSDPYIDLIDTDSTSKWKFLFDVIGKDPKEQRFMFKLDFFLMSAAMLGFFIKTLNENNVATAYVNGMKEYYDMKTNEYNYLYTWWTIGYIAGHIPATKLLHWSQSPRLFLGLLEVVWTILTVLLVLIPPDKVYLLYVLRFFIGLAESGYFPALQFLLGSWYCEDELTKRTCLFSCAAITAGLASGPLQQRILSFKNDKFEPFQWMFILDGFISLPVAAYTYFAIPNLPNTTDAFYFHDEDRLVALERRRRSSSSSLQRMQNPRLKLSVKKWHLYLFPVMYLAANNANQPYKSQSLEQWLKNDLHKDPYVYNVIIPVFVSLLSIVFSMAVSIFNDYLNCTSLFLAFVFISVITSDASLVFWDMCSINYKYWCLISTKIVITCATPLTYSWINRTLAHDDTQRTWLIVITNMFSFLTSSFVPLVTFNQKDAPQFTLGYIYTTFIGIVGLLSVIVARTKLDRK